MCEFEGLRVRFEPKSTNSGYCYIYKIEVKSNYSLIRMDT